MWQLFCNHLGAIFYRRPYYRMMREIVGENRSARHRRYLYAFDCVLFIYLHRLLWLAYLMYTDYAPIRSASNLNGTLRNDFVLGYVFTNSHRFDSFIFVALYLFVAFYWFCETTYRRLGPRLSITWRWWYQSVVGSQNAYRAAILPEKVIAARRRQLEIRYAARTTPLGAMLPSVIRDAWCSIAARVRLWWTLSNVDQRQLFAAAAKRSPHDMPYLSIRLRRTLILILLVGDYLAFILQILIVIVYVAVLISFVLNQHKQFYTSFALARMVAEIYLMHYITQRLVRSAIFCTYCSFLGTAIYPQQLINYYKQMWLLIRRYRHINRNKQKCAISGASLAPIEPSRYLNRLGPIMRIPLLSRKLYGPTIDMILSEHNQNSFWVLRSSEDMFGRLMFAFMLTNLPINVYIVQRITFQTLTSLDFAATLITFWFQFFATLMVIGPMARCCAIYHLPARFIPALQAIMRTTRWLPCKLKYDDLYGRLVSGPKIGLFIGPMEAITYRTALESILIYAAYIMMSFSRKIATKLQRSEF